MGDKDPIISQKQMLFCFQKLVNKESMNSYNKEKFM